MNSAQVIELIKTARIRRPLIHILTNTVTKKVFCVNALLALGGAPICTRDVTDTEQCAAKVDGVLINIGTFDTAIFWHQHRRRRTLPTREKFPSC